MGLEWCSGGRWVWSVWEEGGLSQCFGDTLAALVQGSLLLVLGLAQAFLYHRRSQPKDPGLKPASRLHTLQLLLHAIPPCVAVARLLSHLFLHANLPPLGHSILRGAMAAVLWPLAAGLVQLERHRELVPRTEGPGHGLPLLLFWSASLALQHLPFLALKQSLPDRLSIGLFAGEYSAVLLAWVLGLMAPGLPSRRLRRQFLYGRLTEEEGGPATAQPPSASQGSTWRNVAKKLGKLLPYLWPMGQPGLQLCVLGSLAMLLAGRVVNVYVPLYSKYIVNELAEKVFCWELILAYAGLRFLQGSAMSGGALGTLRSFLWIRVQQFTSREIQIELYRHLHSLSLRWHVGRKTGEVLRVMDRGTSSVNQLFSYVLFNIAPTIVDILIAIAYLTAAFNLYFGLVVFVTMVAYLVLTTGITEWRTKFRRQMNTLDNATRTKGVDSLLNYETVKYYGQEEFEIRRYREALEEYQAAEWLSMASLSLLNSAQNVVIGAGLLGGSLLCASFVAQGRLTVGDYVLFAAYLIQLYQPLNYLGTYYRMIQQSFIDMENMFDLLSEEEEVRDAPGALEIRLRKPEAGASVEFRNVTFAYSKDAPPVLNGVSFKVEAGETLGIVGASGVGKSTIIRLLFRFYDVQGGDVLVDGQSVAGLTQRSLRRHIGVVPQDTVLFNDSIAYNIAYGREGATEKEVEAAAEKADVHAKVLGFPQGYATVVGERGLKLSGGEKQRVAIARTLLKRPALVLLDEATSALDSATERNIQKSLEEVSVGRTTLIVAHRLSTVRAADRILVLEGGAVAEEGAHDDLLRRHGLYAAMWTAQQADLQTPAQDPQSQDQDPAKSQA